MQEKIVMKKKNTHQRGITLIELLVVIAIMMILTAVVLPQLEFGNEGHKSREAARIVSTYLSAARNKAIETGRPCGVLFERVDELKIDNDGDGINETAIASVQMIQVQTPAPYAGDSMDCRVQVTKTGPITFQMAPIGSIQVELLRVGDTVQLGYKGPWFKITGPDDYNNKTDDPTPDGIVDKSATAFNTEISVDYSGRVPNYGGEILSFQIRRNPISQSNQTIRSMTPPQKLPLGTAVDFTASGIGGRYFSSTNDTVSIMFDANGSVQSVTGLVGGTTIPIEPIYLLVGQELHVPEGQDVSWYEDPNIKENDKRPNWQNPDSRWVVIAPSTGITTVAQNATEILDSSGNPWALDGTPDDGDNPPGTQNDKRIEVQAEAIPEARKIAGEGLDGGDR